MRFNTFSRRGMAALAAAAAMGGAVMPVTVFADGDTQPVQNSHVEGPGVETWEGTVPIYGDDGSASPDGGSMDTTYDTTGGTWRDSQGVSHKNGTYVVRIPKAIKYENMNVGTVNTSNDYDVTVEGILPPNSSVILAAETGKPVTGEGLVGDIKETTSLTDGTAGGKKGEYAMPSKPGDSNHNYHEFADDQCSMMESGKVKGTTVKDNIAMSGTALSAGAYITSVTYFAVLDIGPTVDPTPGGTSGGTVLQ